MRTLEIPLIKFNAMSFKIEALAKICRKLSLPEPRVEIIGSKFKKVQIPIGKDDRGIIIFRSAVLEHKIVTVDGIEPKLDGWSFKAKMDIDQDQVMVRSIEGFNLGNLYRSRKTCDHCNTSRYRKSYFFMESDETKEMKQVGSSCIKDFFGHHRPETVASWFTHISEIGSMESVDDIDLGGRGSSYISSELDTAINVIIGIIKSRGYLSKKKAQEEGMEYFDTTAYKSQVSIFDESPSDPTEDEMKEVTEFKSYFMSKQSDKDFDLNVQSIIKSGFVTRHGIASLAAAIAFWHKDAQSKLNKAETEHKDYKYYGAVGHTLDAAVVLVRKDKFETHGYSYYAPTKIMNIYEFEDADGHLFIWFTGVCLPEGVEIGAAVRLKGKVKKHEIRMRNLVEMKQTHMTRCKISVE